MCRRLFAESRKGGSLRIELVAIFCFGALVDAGFREFVYRLRLRGFARLLYVCDSDAFYGLLCTEQVFVVVLV